jgi:IclR family transcriptional regulator, acetate operon repressor
MSSSTVKSAERTMDVLELLAANPRPLPTMTIARRCGIPKSSTYHLLNALRGRGFVAYHEEQRSWSIGDRAREISRDAPTIAEIVSVLDSFDREAQHLEPADIARRANMHVGTATRALALLAAEGLVTQQPNGSFALGLRLVSLSTRLNSIEQLRDVARPTLLDIRDQTGETANLLVRDGSNVVYLDQVESRHALRHTGWAGRSIPLQASAAGNALLSASGVHVVCDAVEPGVTAVATAIGVSIQYPAAISITGPSVRLNGQALELAGETVESAARRIARDFAELRPSRGRHGLS